MTRKLSYLAVALTLFAGSALAQQQTQSTTYPEGSNPTSQQVAPSDQTTADAAQTPAQQAPATESSTSTDPSTMPATASPLPLVGMTGISLLLAGVALSARRRFAS